MCDWRYKGAIEMNKNTDAVERLKNLLKTLFQFDAGELDFGIYRIMNHRRKEIENFIEKDLIQIVEKEFEQYRQQSNKELIEKIQVKKKEIEKLEKELGEQILKNGEIVEKFRDKPFAKEYLDLIKQLNETEITETIQNQVFNDLYEFFSRYYEDGDFISKRRRGDKYVIPYSGEEVKLYWANFDQYYIKTGEVFKDYSFDLKGWKIIFRTIFAEVEVGNIKGEKKYFFLKKDNPIEIDNKQKTCIVYFEYRPLSGEDIKNYKVKTKEGGEKTTGIKQEELNSIIKDKIIEQIEELELKAFLSETKEKDEKNRTILEWNLYKYTRKITSDFFIHKDLKGFLERELDYFIKAEVIDLKNLDQRHITRAKVVEGIARKIIEFLAQIEDFQKLLWEKKKFVLRTEYVITIDKIPSEFYNEILKNKEQLKEWEELGFGKIRDRNDIKDKKLPVDTKYFSQDFKEKLLEKLSEKGNIDELLDGVLIKSENWQALNLMLEKYKEKVQTIYIDPPFNKENEADYLYKVQYKDSTWISLLENRLWLARELLNEKGSIFVRCDYNGNWLVRPLMNGIFGEENFRNEIIVTRGEYPKGEVNKLRTGNDNIFFYSKSEKNFFVTPKKGRQERKWFSMHLAGERGSYELQVRDFFGKKLLPPKGRHWMISQEKINELIKKGEIRINENKTYIDLAGNIVKGEPEMLQAEFEILDSNWTDIQSYSTGWGFRTENSEILLKRVIESTSNEGNLVMDFFLGSGTTTAVAHKLKRKWIGVEMGEHFYTVVLPRMKKVLAYDKSGISKEKDVKEKYNEKNAGGFFKYHYLEQYEDTLHNIEFVNKDKGEKALELFGNEYLMKYFLRYETEGCQALLNIKNFENPFEYKMKIISGNKGEEIINVDLVETFNYLLGLTVNKYKFLTKDGRKYVFVFGEKENRKVAVIWRPTKDIDLEKDKEIIEETISFYAPNEIYINGDAYVKNYKVIESEFKALMGV